MLTQSRLRMLGDQLLRSLGVSRTWADNYHYRVGPGDIVRMTLTEEAIELTLAGMVAAIEDHGWYSTITLRLETGELRPIRLYRQGPVDESGAAIECEIVERRHVPLPRDPGRI